MSLLFLYGDVDANFGDITRPFVEASLERVGPIALLLQGGPDWQRYVDRYRDPWLGHGAAGVVPIVPGPGGTVDGAALENLESCSAAFVGGGHTPTYHSLYVDSAAGEVIRRRVASGLPYGGVSAGALLAGDPVTLEGTRAPDGDPPARLLSLAVEADVPLRLGTGFGFLANTVIEAHVAELGGLPRLATAMERAGVERGLGLDEPAGLTVDGDQATVLGAGRVYLVVRTEPGTFTVRWASPGSTLRVGV